jgi:hypothetical protein
MQREAWVMMKISFKEVMSQRTHEAEIKYMYFSYDGGGQYAHML